jgi:hypothetical protein
MIKLLLIVLIVVLAFWMGRKSAGAGRKEVQKRDTDDTSTVIDIETED